MYRPAHLVGACVCAAFLAATPPAASAALAATGTVTLHLQPGLHGPWFTASFSSLFGPALDIPLGTIDVSVPVYPDATPTTETESMPSFGVPQSLYLKSDWTAYLLATDPASAKTWYQQAFAAAGYTASSTGSSSDAHTGATSLQIVFASTTMSAVNLTVALSLEDDAQGHTIVDYEAFAITIPPRDPATLLPNNVVRVEVTYRLPWASESSPRPPDLHSEVTAPAGVQALVAAFNALPRDERPAGAYLCLNDGGAGATLAFVRGDGGTVTATIDPACSSVSVAGEPPLRDTDGQLWSAVQNVMATQLAALTATPTSLPSLPTPQPTVPSAPAALALSTHVDQASVVSGHTLTVSIHTAPFAYLRIMVQALQYGMRPQVMLRQHGKGRRASILYQVARQGYADAHGRFVGHMRITYQPRTPVEAALTVIARRGARTVTWRSRVAILPAR